MDLIVRRAHRRGEGSAARPGSPVARLPVNVLHSELCLGTAPLPDRHIAQIVDGLFLPLAAGHPA